MASRQADEAKAHQAFGVLMDTGNGLLAQLKAGRVTLANAKQQAAAARQQYVAYKDQNITVDSVRRAMMNEYDPSRCEYICAFDNLVSTFDANAPVAVVGPGYVAPTPKPSPSVASSGFYDSETGGDLPIVNRDDIGSLQDDSSPSVANSINSFVGLMETPVGPLPIWAWVTLGLLGYEVVIKGGK